MTNAFLEVESLSASYEIKQIVKQVSFSIEKGELACLLGPSGCGKTTILRAISGFRAIDEGTIKLNSAVISKPNVMLPPEKRNIGMVFQDHALFPHLTIEQNIAFGLHKKNKDYSSQAVQLLLKLIGMQNFAGRYPHELSGGQSQRVALARAIAPKPDLLLLDEPFSNLDSDLRESLGYEVREVLQQQGITTIMVTHDQHDAFALGDKVGIMNDGQLLQWDTSYNLYHAPNSRFVANFIGDGVFVKGMMRDENVVITNFAEISGQSVNANFPHEKVDLLLRPDDIKFDSNSSLKCSIKRKAFKGAQTLYTLEFESGDTVVSLLPSHENFEIDDTIGVTIDADHLVCFKS